MPDIPTDAFATAKANLRDTVKWLAAALAAVAAAVIGTSPLTTLGSLAISDPRFQLAVLSLSVAVVSLVIGVAIILDLLISDTFYLEEVRGNPYLRNIVSQHRADLLPPDYQELIPLLDERNDAAAIMYQNRGSPAGTVYQTAFARYQRVAPTLGTLTSLLHLEKLKAQLRSTCWVLLVITLVGGLALTVYAWAANPPKPPTAPTGGASAPGQP
ncbi:MAG: hypothetical protein QOK29_4229 [Rhodospirillaceae bacterium]|nr:hypothetical protein [Rhodospirillaceae bacterium]